MGGESCYHRIAHFTCPPLGSRLHFPSNPLVLKAATVWSLSSLLKPSMVNASRPTSDGINCCTRKAKCPSQLVHAPLPEEILNNRNQHPGVGINAGALEGRQAQVPPYWMGPTAKMSLQAAGATARGANCPYPYTCRAGHSGNPQEGPLERPWASSLAGQSLSQSRKQVLPWLCQWMGQFQTRYVSTSTSSGPSSNTSTAGSKATCM